MPVQKKKNLVKWTCCTVKRYASSLIYNEKVKEQFLSILFKIIVGTNFFS